MKTARLAFVSLVLLSSCACDRAPHAYRGPIIDVHLHSMRLDQPLPTTGSSGLINPATGQPASAKNGQALLDETLAEMGRHQVVLGFVFNGSGVEGFGSEFDWSEQSQGRLRYGSNFVMGHAEGGPLVWVSPEKLRDMARSKPFHAFGELGLPYMGLRADDPRLEPYWALAEELDIPVGVHTGVSFPGIAYDPCCPGFRSELGNPQHLEEVLAKHLNLRVYLMHAGFPFRQEALAVLELYPQVYVDIGAIDWLLPDTLTEDYVRDIVRAGYGNRIMFGSDQIFWPDAIGIAVNRINNLAFLTVSQKADIFCGNAARFFRLQPNPCPASEPDPGATFYKRRQRWPPRRAEGKDTAMLLEDMGLETQPRRIQ